MILSATALAGDEESAEGVDAGLVERCRRGERQAFDELVDRYQSKVYNLAYRLLGDRDAAADVAQEAFLRVYRGIRTFHGVSALTTWIYRIVHNLCLDEMKKRRRRPQVVEEPPEPEDGGGESLIERLASETDEPEEEALAGERRRYVREAIDRLRPHHREVIVLYDIQGLSYREVARVLKTNVGTIKSRLNRARLSLARELDQDRELFG